MQNTTIENPKLSQLQRWFSEAILKTKASNSPSYEAFIEGRLHIYQEAYFIRISSALSSDFKVLCRSMGQESFNTLVQDLLKFQPSRYTNINEIGRELAPYLKQSEYEVEVPFLSHLAQLEWALIESFWANDKAPLNVDCLTAETSLTLHPAVRLLTFPFDVVAIRENFEKSDEEFFKFPEEKNVWVCVYRSSQWPEIHRLSEEEFEILKELSSGRTLASLGESLSKLKDLTKTFKTWTEMGILVLSPECTA